MWNGNKTTFPLELAQTSSLSLHVSCFQYFPFPSLLAWVHISFLFTMSNTSHQRSRVKQDSVNLRTSGIHPKVFPDDWNAKLPFKKPFLCKYTAFTFLLQHHSHLGLDSFPWWVSQVVYQLGTIPHLQPISSSVWTGHLHVVEDQRAPLLMWKITYNLSLKASSHLHQMVRTLNQVREGLSLKRILLDLSLFFSTTFQ
jgi:hypothetical protein